MFHFGMWRERMRNALTDLAEGRPTVPPPPNTDEVNDAELPGGIGTPLTDAAARSDHLLSEIIELYGRVGDRPFEWYRAKTTTDAVLGNSYTHPRTHIYEYLLENGDVERAVRLFEDAVPEMTAASSAPGVRAIALYNLACARVHQKRIDEAFANLKEALQVRPDLREVAAADTDMVPLKDDARFQELIKP